MGQAWTQHKPLVLFTILTFITPPAVNAEGCPFQEHTPGSEEGRRTSRRAQSQGHVLRGRGFGRALP